QSLFHRMSVSILGPSTPIKTAKLTVGDADIRVVEMSVDVVIGRQPVLFATDVVGKLADRIEIGRAVQSDALVKGKPLTGVDSVRNIVTQLIGRKTHSQTARTST